MGCSDESKKNPNTASKNKNIAPKPMIDSTEFTSLDTFLKDKRAGFLILHQERALGSDSHDEDDVVTPKLAERFEHFLADLKSRLGEPEKQAREWDLGIPTFASGNGYALWNQNENFISLFVSWDNPEDPSFVIVARAPLTSFDSEPGAPDPWESKWMEKGEW
jgi:hypothetical protein